MPDDALEVRQRDADWNREILPAAGCDSHVLSKNWCPLLRRDCDKVDAASAALTDDGSSVCGLDILDPIGFRPEHRYEIMLTFDASDPHGVRPSAAGCATTDFQNRLESRRQPKSGPPTSKAVDPPAKTCRPPVAVKQSH